jgi:N-acetylglucosamine-6-sulfatase
MQAMRTARWIARAALALVLVAATGGAASVGAAPKPRPNIIVIETDDQAVETLRVMANVQRLLADQGTTFENSFASWPLCCPSRATFLTGQYAHNHGVLGNRAPEGGYEKLDHSNTLAVWLQRAGYHTAHVGKYLNGYGSRENETEIPPGWSEWHAGTRLPFFGHSLNENGQIVTFGFAEQDYSTDVYARIAQDIVRRQAPQPQPFFIWLAFFAPHSGGPPDPDDPRGIATTKPAPRHRDAFASEALPQSPSFNEQDVSDKPAGIRSRPPLNDVQVAGIREAYQQQLESLLAVDEAVAALFNQLQASGELANTLIIFTADNGFFHGQHRVPSGKNLVYEPSIRVPLIVRGPGVPRGLRLKQLVANIDLAPTIVATARARAGRALDGRSLLPLLARPRTEWKRDLLLERTGTEVLGRRNRARNQTFTAIRTPRYVYAEYGNGERELYDLAVDPDELVSSHADPAYAAVRDDLARRLARLRVCAGAGCR